ncbi:STAS domain-containing protein [Parahaliea maris]|uniref:STAS domain-containing protein n=1 Tax=Parahaliea maris TaxID=2716870 RepID=A0A5C9A2I7_9GAMM|nr:STAS domain-containing protein [Parahaliea maris]TXS93827.1 STAS domain-containing protein [Parahaliea maris]
MKLDTKLETDGDRSVARLYLIGALNSDTAPEFETILEGVLAKGLKVNVLDMRDLDYISSAGLRVIFKAAKQATAAHQRLAASHRKPHIEKVFEILKALPDMAVFANDQELDDYLDAMQARSLEG